MLRDDNCFGGFHNPEVGSSSLPPATKKSAPYKFIIRTGERRKRIGIVPDIIKKPTTQGIKEGRDELLEKALEVINSN